MADEALSDGGSVNENVHVHVPPKTQAYPQKPKGRNKRHLNEDKTVEPRRITTWKPQTTVKRCTLQTLGGTESNSPLPARGTSNAHTAKKMALKKNRSLGGGNFHDSCYMSSEDEREASTKHAWALSPSDVAKGHLQRTFGKKRSASVRSRRPTSFGKRVIKGDDDDDLSPVEEVEEDSHSDRDSHDSFDWDTELAQLEPKARAPAAAGRNKAPVKRRRTQPKPKPKPEQVVARGQGKAKATAKATPTKPPARSQKLPGPAAMADAKAAAAAAAGAARPAGRRKPSARAPAVKSYRGKGSDDSDTSSADDDYGSEDGDSEASVV